MGYKLTLTKPAPTVGASVGPTVGHGLRFTGPGKEVDSRGLEAFFRAGNLDGSLTGQLQRGVDVGVISTIGKPA